MTDRTIVAGDIHACAEEFFELLEKARVGSDDIVVAAGDMLDRGPDPWRVYEYFKFGGRRLAIMGNHERKHSLGLLSLSQRITQHMLGDRYPEVLGWMRGLPLYLDLPDVLVVHAAYVPGVSLEQQDPAILVGHMSGEKKLERLFPGGEWWLRHELGKPVVFGHLSQPKIELRPGLVYALGGGCVKGGGLHAVIFPGGQIVSVPARKKHWPEIKSYYDKRKNIGTLAWPRIRVLAEDKGCPAALQDELRRLLATMDGLADRVVERVQNEAADLLGGFGNDERGEAFLAFKHHPLRDLLLEVRFDAAGRKRILAKLKRPKAFLGAAKALGISVPVELSAL